MSEKLYKVIEAVDLLDENKLIPERYLVFENQDGNLTKVFFPNDRMALILDGVLYDWYGREVRLSTNIAKVLSHYGCSDDASKWHETFVVERTDKRLAIAELHYEGHHSATYQNLAKIANTGWIIDQKPFLKCQHWSFSKFYELPDSTNCFDAINETLSECCGTTCKICIDAGYDNLRYPIVFSKHKGYSGTISSYWLEHYIFVDRNSILGTKSCNLKNLNVRKDIVKGISGDLSFSKDKNKMTAYLRAPHGNIRISTDVEVIRHTQNHQEIFWYYDPEP